MDAWLNVCMYVRTRVDAVDQNRGVEPPRVSGCFFFFFFFLGFFNVIVNIIYFLYLFWVCSGAYL